MRKNYNGLSALVKNALGDDPLSGSLFVFVNRRHTQMKILYFDRTGYAIWSKRLEQGQFVIHDKGCLKRLLSFAELQGLTPDQFELIDVKKYYRLAQRPASYVVLAQRPASYVVICYEQPVYKLLADKKIVNAITPMSVLDKSVADVSFLVGLLVDKFQYHLPLYRQHQRLEAAGITLSRKLTL